MVKQPEQYPKPLIPSWLYLLISGLVIGSQASGWGVQLFGLAAYLPLLIVLDRIHRERYVWWKQALYSFLCCYGVAIIAGGISVRWMINAAHDFGHLPWVISVPVVSLGYGLELSWLLFCLLALPLLFIRKLGWWDVVFRVFYFIALEPWLPRLVHWSFGGITFVQIPGISQLADVIGASGLGFYAMGANFLLLLWWRQHTGNTPITRLAFASLIAIYSALWIIGLGYGSVRTEQLQITEKQGEAIHVAAVQPNFSFQHLSMNPNRSESDRQHSIFTLLQDSSNALKKFPDDNAPRLVVWPESAFPFAYLQDSVGRQLVERFAREHETALLFQSLHSEREGERVKHYGMSLLVDQEGQLLGRYDKIFLFPFGEYIPGAETFPEYRLWVKQMVPRISEFEAGTEYTVFSFNDQIQLSAPICFDALSPDITRGMAKEGSLLAINLSNLSWYGTTNASFHMEMTIHWNAIENRIPLLNISNNGRTMFYDIFGKVPSPTIELFEHGTLSQTLYLKKRFSLYRDYREWVEFIFILLALLMGGLGHYYAQLFKRSPLPPDFQRAMG